MSLLTIDVGGANETTVAFARAGHAEPRRIGARRFAFAGNERSMIRAESHVVPVLLSNIPAATIATIRSIFANGTQVLCDGDVFNNSGSVVVCAGEITDEMEVGGTYWTGTLTLTQTTTAAGRTMRDSVAPAGVGTASVTINGFRRGTVLAAGAATVTVALKAKRSLTVSVVGLGTTVASRVAKRRLTAASAGVATTTATETP
jgi:hypothetical protein